jgi:ATP-dependent exoDNAse (exonuclease V) beta subunit
MTVHGAKGLEAKVVFVAYAEDKRLPKMDDSRLLFDPQFGDKPGFGLMVSTGYGLGDLKKQVYKNIWYQPRIETEEKRLFYVALTRGMERMIVTRARQSIEWTAPDAFSEAQLEAHWEQEEAEWFDRQYWQVPTETLKHRLDEVLAERAKQSPVSI